MTLSETEETIKTLQSRHQGLNEEMLITLLQAGGWENKHIEEAKMIFRSLGNRSIALSKVESKNVPLPPLQESHLFIPQADVDHLLEEHNTVTEVVSVPQPQSLVVERVPVQQNRNKEELPHNLPLRPFETSEHIWPFSRYRDVFYGDLPAEPKIEKTEVKTHVNVTPQVTVHVDTPAPQPPEVRVVEKIVERIVEKPVPYAVPVSTHTAPQTGGGDEKLVILACVMLLTILLLLGYMYSNGRL